MFNNFKLTITLYFSPMHLIIELNKCLCSPFKTLATKLKLSYKITCFNKQMGFLFGKNPISSFCEWVKDLELKAFKKFQHKDMKRYSDRKVICPCKDSLHKSNSKTILNLKPICQIFLIISGNTGVFGVKMVLPTSSACVCL